MRKARELKFVSKEGHAWRTFAVQRRPQSPQARARFERLLIVLLCTLWGVGVVLWTLVSLVGFGYAPSSAAQAITANPLPASMPTVQTAVVITMRLMFGW